MAKNDREATFTLRVKEIGADLLDRFRVTLGDVIEVAKGAYEGLKKVVETMFELALNASQFNEVKSAFHEMATGQGQDADKLLLKMREMSRGVVTDFDLMKQANKAMMLDVPVDKFADLMGVAKTASEKTGQSMTETMNSVMSAVSRGSDMALKHLGIHVELEQAQNKYAASINKTAAQLTDYQKRLVLINEVLRVSKQGHDDASQSAESLEDKWSRLKVTASNLTIQFGQGLAPAFTKLVELGQKGLNIFSGFVAPDIPQLTKQLDLLYEKKKKLETDGEAQGWAAAFASADSKVAIQQQIDAIESLIQKKKEDAKTDDEAAQTKRKAFEEEQILKQATTDANNAIAIEQNQRLQEGLKDVEIKAKLDLVNKRIAAETNSATKIKLIKDKEKLEGDARRKGDELEEEKLTQKRLEMASLIATHTQGLLNNIAALTKGHNSGILVAAKQLGVALIIINTLIAAMRARAELGPVLGSIASGIIYAEGATSVAIAEGLQLAEGGIVKATPGGVPAIIGEGGRDEAVIPLDSNGAPAIGGNHITIISYGGLLGNAQEARDFALAVDKELLGLRQTRQSQAFDFRG